MIVVCLGWHRTDGTRVHEEEIVLGERKPIDDKRKVHSICEACDRAMKEQLRVFTKKLKGAAVDA